MEGAVQDNAKALVRMTATVAEATPYTVAAGCCAIVRAIDVCNKTATPKSVTVKLGGFCILAGLVIPANDMRSWTNTQVLGPGGAISVSASADNAVDVHVSGSEHSPDP
jgi:hypothetical protein